MNYAIEFIYHALSTGAIELVPELRKLKSGRMSPYFFNSGLYNTGVSLNKLANAYQQVIYKTCWHPEVIFGLSYKGSALAVAISVFKDDTTGFAYNRKEAKDHGEGGIIIGMPLKGKRVVVVDDVTTTGSSLAESCDIIQKAGGIPVGCVVAFDRQEIIEGSNLSAIDNFEKNYEVPVRSIATLEDLIYVLEKMRIEKARFVLPKILEYKKSYGVKHKAN